ncbi:MAG TPA: ribose-phosphate diphosphokinase [Gammaproteobacteria bacterium]|nr:ribose-phosphate diphosphokinase [Gammaproteobacteria bacterium]
MTKLLLVSGNANLPLSEKIAKRLNQRLGKTLISQFGDGETRVEILEPVRDRNVYIIQPTSMPTNHHTMELLLIADALKRAEAYRIIAVIPYFGYARQNKPLDSIIAPISAKVVADLLKTVGIDHVITVDLHTEPGDIFFEKSIHNLSTTQLFLDDLIETMSHKKDFNPLVVSPDTGGVARAKAFAKKLNNSELVVIDKHRPNPNDVKIRNMSGNVKDRDCVIIDDMIDTGNTLCSAARALKAEGAGSVIAYITHPVLSGEAVKNVGDSSIDELVVTDTIVLSAAAKACKKIRVHSVAMLIAKEIAR